MIQTEVYCSLQIEGLHCWPEAKILFPEVAYLSDPHRHIFHIKCHSKVNHDDRDVEFIMLKHSVDNFMQNWYDPMYNLFDFGRMSCEDIAQSILDEFDSIYKVEVSEDGENGCIKQRV